MLEQNKTLSYAVIGLAIAALVTITVWQPGEWSFRNKTDYDAQRRQAEQELAQYQKFLDSIQPDYESSQQLLKKIATEEVVRQEIEETLNTKQKIVIPEVPSSEILISNRSDKDAVVNYVNDVSSMVENLRGGVSPAVQSLYADNPNTEDLKKAQTETDTFVANLKKMSVPAPVAQLHKANIVSFSEYGELFDESQKYAVDNAINPWPQFYQNYSIIDNRLAVVRTELDRLNKQYALDQNTGVDIAPPFIKTAQAQFGTVTVITADLERQIIEGIKEALAKSFAQFAVKMLDKLVAHIEKNFAIASQLYYSNELNRFYSVEYMKKFVSDPLDQDIIKNFLPEYFCVSPDKSKLRDIFVAKARQNVGSDIVINPADPDFLTKLARLGADEKNYPLWWEGYYESLAAKTQSEAESASAKEVVSPGLKTGRDIISSQVNKTMAAVFNVQEAAISGTINLGTNNVSSPVSQLVAGVVETMINKFIFTPIGGGSSSSGGIGILQEKSVCLQVPEIKPLVPVASSDYSTSQGPVHAPVSTPPFNPR